LAAAALSNVSRDSCAKSAHRSASCLRAFNRAGRVASFGNPSAHWLSKTDCPRSLMKFGTQTDHARQANERSAGSKDRSFAS